MGGMLSPGQALHQFAAYAARVPGIREAHYPAPAALPKSRSVIVHWGGLRLLGSEEQTWILYLRAHLVSHRLGDTAKEISEIDSLVPPLIDAFAAGTPGFHLTSPDGLIVDSCGFRADVEAPFNAQMGYGGHQYYGHELPFVIQLRRFRGDPN